MVIYTLLFCNALSSDHFTSLACRVQHDDTKLGKVGGMDFDAMLASEPERREEILTLRDYLLASDDEEPVQVCVCEFVCFV